jgi:glycosidase
VFGGPAWEWDDATEQHYLHSYLPSQPDLNWRNPAVRSAMFDTLRFWLDRGVDGIRIDVAEYLMKDPALRDNPPASATPHMFKARGDYDTLDHVHDKAHPDVHAVFRQLRQILDRYEGERVCIGEVHEWNPARWASYYGRNGDELHMPFNFSLLHTPWSAGEVRRRVEMFEDHLTGGAWPNHVLGNHEESRLASRFGPERARVAAMLLLTLRGTPTLYCDDHALPCTPATSDSWILSSAPSSPTNEPPGLTGSWWH